MNSAVLLLANRLLRGKPCSSLGVFPVPSVHQRGLRFARVALRHITTCGGFAGSVTLLGGNCVARWNTLGCHCCEGINHLYVG